MNADAADSGGDEDSPPSKKRKVSKQKAASVTLETSPAKPAPGKKASAGAAKPGALPQKGVKKGGVPAISSAKGPRGPETGQSPDGSDEEEDETGQEATAGQDVPPSKGENDGGPAAQEGREEEDEDEEPNFELNLSLAKIPTMSAEKMQSVLSKFTPEQMSRYESYRRSGFQRSTMKKLLDAVMGDRVKVNVQTTIVMSGIAKLFVGELVETGRIVMGEWGETGPIRPSHIREAYRRLKLEGKVPVQSHPRLF